MDTHLLLWKNFLWKTRILWAKLLFRKYKDQLLGIYFVHLATNHMQAGGRSMEKCKSLRIESVIFYVPGNVLEIRLKTSPC